MRSIECMPYFLRTEAHLVATQFMIHPHPTRIVFVTGASRSGTTMLTRVLGNHSRILGLRELQYFGELCPSNATRHFNDQRFERLAAMIFARQARSFWDGGPTQSERNWARQLRESVDFRDRTGYGLFVSALARLAADAGKLIVCEQTPRNVFYAQDILENLPSASFIHIVRDPRAVAASQKNRWKMRLLGAERVSLSEVIRTWVNYHPVTMAKLWNGATEAALRLRGHERVKLLRFEDLIAEPEIYIQDLCTFLDVEFEPAMHLVPKWGSSNVKHEGDKKGLSKDVLDKWETVLSDGEVEIVERITGELMGRFSYVPRTARSVDTLSMLPYKLGYPLHLLGVALANPRRASIQARAMLLSSRRRS